MWELDHKEGWVSKSHSIVSNSLWPHGLQHAKSSTISQNLLKFMSMHSCPSVSYLTISSFAAPFSFCLQSLPASMSIPMSQLFVSVCQSTGASASALVLPTNIQCWFPLGLTYLISLLSKGLSRVFSSTTIQKHQFFGVQPSLWSNSHLHTWPLEKSWLSLYGPLSAKWCLCFLIHRLGLPQLFFQGTSIF